jgi:hypothetical protein
VIRRWTPSIVERRQQVEIDRLRNLLAQAEQDKQMALGSSGAMAISLKRAEQRNDYLLNRNRMLLDVVQGESLGDEIEAWLADSSQGGES